MSTALWDGEPIFGYSVAVLTTPRPRPVSETDTFGLDGSPSIDGGSRGTDIKVSGELRAPTKALLATAQAVLRYAADGRAHTFTDTAGRDWPQTVADEFAPNGSAGASPGRGYYSQAYTLKLLSLKGTP